MGQGRFVNRGLLGQGGGSFGGISRRRTAEGAKGGGVGGSYVGYVPIVAVFQHFDDI